MDNLNNTREVLDSAIFKLDRAEAAIGGVFHAVKAAANAALAALEDVRPPKAPPPPQCDFLTPKQLSERWQTSEHYLYRLRRRGVGPPYVEMGAARFGGRKTIRYAVPDLVDYERRVSSIAEGAALAAKRTAAEVRGRLADFAGEASQRAGPKRGRARTRSAAAKSATE